jgi:hypothetical protein
MMRRQQLGAGSIPIMNFVPITATCIDGISFPVLNFFEFSIRGDFSLIWLLKCVN